MLVDVAGKILQAYQLRSLGSSFESTSRSPLQFVQSSTIHANGSCVIDSAVLTGVAAAFNSASIQVEADLTLPKRGFFASYNAEDFARMLRKPGCRMNLMRLGNTVLGYSVSYLDPEHLPRHGQRLVAALDSHGLIEDGATIGFVDLIHVTDIGRQICQIARINPTELLHKQIAEDAQAAGINILVAQTREFPHPNHEALKSHKMHGCRDPGVFLLYPTSEGENGWQYSLGRVLVLDLRPKQQS